MTRRRIAPALVAVVGLLAVGVLSSCSVKAGAAAFVGGDRISQSTVDAYVQTNAAPPTTVQGQATANPSSKTLVLNDLILSEVLTKVLVANGGVPSDTQLAALHDQVFSALFNTSLSGVAADQAVRQQIGEPNRLKPSFDAVFLRSNELELTVIQRLKISDANALAAVVAKLNVPVTVNQRYGDWSPSTLSLSAAKAPSFLTLPSSAAPTPAS